MLFLQLPAEAAVPELALALPMDDATALAFERAILAVDRSARLGELKAALAIDRNAASWVLRAAELRLGRTINRVEEAAEWLCDCLVVELAAALRSDGPADSPAATTNGIDWRLPLLTSKLDASERHVAEFERRLEHEKLESLKELAYGASHEINNPLANIAARAQTLLEEEADPERRRKLAAIHRQAMRAHEMIADLMLFARPPKLARASCELNELVRKVVGELSGVADECNAELLFECSAEPIELTADATQLGVAVAAVVKNALEAVSDGGHVHVAARRVRANDREWAEVLVSDDGPGIPDDVRPHIFDPFFSGREAGRGLGFGLSKCWRIVTDHGGRVSVSRRSSGAEIAIQLLIDVSDHS